MSSGQVNRGNAPLFVEAYNDCIESGVDVFMFDGREVHRRYAYYLIELIVSKGWVSGHFDRSERFGKFVSNK